MYEKIKRFEISLVECVFERICQWIQKWVGLDCFFWAKVFSVTGVCMTSVLLWMAVLDQYTIMVFLWGISLVANILDVVIYIPEAKSTCYSDLRQSRKNKLLVIESAVRTRALLVSLLVVSLISPVVIGKFGNGLIVSSLLVAINYFSAFYLSPALQACTPLHPGHSKLRRGIKKLDDAIRRALTPSEGGLPAPA
jgi:hypothetical protein